jgi:hypothetical protein
VTLYTRSGTQQQDRGSLSAIAWRAIPDVRLCESLFEFPAVSDWWSTYGVPGDDAPEVDKMRFLSAAKYVWELLKPST